jgi:hypothetical protein
MPKPPSNLPELHDRVRLRGRPKFEGTIIFINPENNWARVKWDNESMHGPGICHLWELEKI